MGCILFTASRKHSERRHDGSHSALLLSSCIQCIYFLGIFSLAFERMHAYSGAYISGFQQLKPIGEIMGILEGVFSEPRKAAIRQDLFACTVPPARTEEEAGEYRRLSTRLEMAQ